VCGGGCGLGGQLSAPSSSTAALIHISTSTELFIQKIFAKML
jgi:hypothetical protein